MNVGSRGKSLPFLIINLSSQSPCLSSVVWTTATRSNTLICIWGVEKIEWAKHCLYPIVTPSQILIHLKHNLHEYMGENTNYNDNFNLSVKISSLRSCTGCFLATLPRGKPGAPWDCVAHSNTSISFCGKWNQGLVKVTDLRNTNATVFFSPHFFLFNFIIMMMC